MTLSTPARCATVSTALFLFLTLTGSAQAAPAAEAVDPRWINTGDITNSVLRSGQVLHLPGTRTHVSIWSPVVVMDGGKRKKAYSWIFTVLAADVAVAQQRWESKTPWKNRYRVGPDHYHRQIPRPNTGADQPNRLVMQRDCNLVLLRKNNRPAWASNTAGRGTGCHFRVQSDGNAVIYTGAGRAVWDIGRDNRKP